MCSHCAIPGGESKLAVMRLVVLPAALAVIASVATAHRGVEDPEVMARMNLMEEVAAAFAPLSAMAKGERAFDAEVAARAARTLSTGAAMTPALFRSPADDPKSEAKRVIWDDFPDFEAKSAAMGAAADAFAPTTLAELRADLPTLGATCLACHQNYRAKR